MSFKSFIFIIFYLEMTVLAWYNLIIRRIAYVSFSKRLFWNCVGEADTKLRERERERKETFKYPKTP